MGRDDLPPGDRRRRLHRGTALILESSITPCYNFRGNVTYFPICGWLKRFSKEELDGWE